MGKLGIGTGFYIDIKTKILLACKIGTEAKLGKIFIHRKNWTNSEVK